MKRFYKLRDWRRWQVIQGKGDMLTENSPNPYIRRIIIAARRYGWDCPFSVAIGKRLPEDKAFLYEWKKKQVSLQKSVSKSGSTIEERLLNAIFDI